MEKLKAKIQEEILNVPVEMLCQMQIITKGLQEYLHIFGTDMQNVIFKKYIWTMFIKYKCGHCTVVYY